jgi:hypothetical protein
MVRGVLYGPRLMDTQMDTCFGAPRRHRTHSRDGFQLRAPKVKSRVAGDVLEVCIGAKQFCPDVETRLGDDTVHSSTHGDASASQGTE